MKNAMSAALHALIKNIGATARWAHRNVAALVDSIGSNDCTLVSGASFIAPIHEGGFVALQCIVPGGGGTAAAAALPTAAGTDLWSVFMVFRTSNVSDTIWSQHAASLDTSCHLHITSGGFLRFRKNASTAILTGAVNISDGLIHTTALTHETDGTCKQYVDGARDPAGTGSYTDTIVDEPFRMGGKGSSFASPYDGDLLPVAVFDDTVLTAAQILQLHNIAIADDKRQLARA